MYLLPLHQLPNTLSFFRIIGAVCFPFLEGAFLKFCLLVALAITDFLDGFFARRLMATSKLGTVLDPLADKLLAITCCYAFFFDGTLKIWQIAALFTREIALCLFFIILQVQDRWRNWQLQSFYIGKITTTLQFFLFLLLSNKVSAPDWIYYLIAILGFLSLFELLKRSLCVKVF